MKLKEELLNSLELEVTEQKLFDSLTIYQDNFDSKYIALSFEDEFYLNQDELDSISSIIEDNEDILLDGELIGTLYNLGYNI